MGWPNSQRLGKLCSAGHSWNELGVSLRNRQGHCIKCKAITRLETERQKALDPEYRARRSAAAKERNARRMAQDPEGEMRRRKETHQRRVQSGKVREYKAALRQRLLDQGLTTRGRERVNSLPLQPLQPLQRALRDAGRSPSVARLVMNEQLRHWREHPSERKAHYRRWAQVRWWLEYQTKPDLRLYHREKSKRRKAQNRGQTPLQISVSALRQRFNEFGNCCAYCGAGGDMEIEHVCAISKGGAHDIGNIVPACSRCNTSKSNSDMEDWYRFQPFFSELRLHRIQQVLRPPDGEQLDLGLA